MTDLPSVDPAGRGAVPPGARAPYVIAGLVAAIPLFALLAAAPGGGQWRWLELPGHTTLIALGLGLAACFSRWRGIAVVVVLGTVAGNFLWALVSEYLVLRRLGQVGLFGDDARLIASHTIGMLAPWLVGTLYGALAWLAVPALDRARGDRFRAAVWLCAVGIIAIIVAMNNESWLTLENLGHRGRFRSSTAWPDTKVLSLVFAAVVSIASAAVALRAWRASQPTLPRATLRE